ncbi:hypothetical protein H0H81_008881 [Sphagnurus paluster]|uniref:Gem-associated protein 2 n=1 Tax=Sphagnurus paluster TaxID=117069 RepID=A0A9P7GQP8_9AGAR|nr:hypothetical protein H0H81_008881 [Sphagnurus paluster]
MTPYKRKYEELDDSDEEEPSFGKQILPVANLPEDFNGEPMDGMQYLFTVRRDARHLPHITRAPNPYEMNAPTSSKTDDRVIPPHPSLPSEEWRSIFNVRLKNFRKNLVQPTIDVALPPQGEHRRLMPDKKERELWWGFLAGKPESDWNPGKAPKQSAAQRRLLSLAVDPSEPSVEHKRQHSWQTNDEGEVELVLSVDPSESLPTPTGSPTPSEFGEPEPSSVNLGREAVAYKPREPLPSLLRYIDERMALHLLMYFTHWINLHLQRPDPSSRPIETHARWIFALLSKIDDQLSADDMSLLRNLARACIALLKELLQNQTPSIKVENPATLDRHGGYMSSRSCWIILSAVAGVWAQRDLWNDAEDMLKSLGPT